MTEPSSFGLRPAASGAGTRACIPRLSIALSLALAGCGAPEVRPDPARAIPASVRVRPGTMGVLRSPLSGPDRPPPGPIDAAPLVREVAAGLRKGGVFAEVQEGRADSGPPADYVCEVTVWGRIDGEESGATWMALLSSIVWFPTIIPAWWIPDRAYPGSEVEVIAVIAPLRKDGRGRPVLVASSKIADPRLPLVDRGVPWQYLLSLILPPFWMSDGERAREGLAQLVAARAGAEILEALRSDWPAAALAGEAGCLLILDPPGVSIAAEDGRADLRGWLGARKPARELQVLDSSGKVLRRLDRDALARLDAGGPGIETTRAKAAWAAVERRFGPVGPRPVTVYRLDLQGLPVSDRADVLRVKAWIVEEPACFTVRLSHIREERR